ncbi:hypothetical protein F4778DRAFT_578453 [Xylariomycetidae sp. FL2044]|nr:hypothetical protein F4778DRAFT_578453 [Xylariomycetidae sp. FL2044]
MASSTTTPSSQSLTTFLQSVIPPSKHHAYTALATSVLPALITSVVKTARTLRSSHHVSQAGTANAFGDDQLNVDVAAERHIREAIARCPSVVCASSEEDPVERRSSAATDADALHLGPEQEQYTVAFDPLDGSSIIAPNWTVGSIIGVWTGATALRQKPAEAQVAAVLGVFGPRTTAVVALRLPGCGDVCFEIGLDDTAAAASGGAGADGGDIQIEMIRPTVKLATPPVKTRYFAPANLRAAADDERYMRLVTHFVTNKYTLRYSGGLVPDVVHVLVKGHGVYVSPVTAASKAKLRRLFELCPLALIVECAGGQAADPVDGSRILDRPLADVNERGGLVCGTREDVDLACKMLLG